MADYLLSVVRDGVASDFIIYGAADLKDAVIRFERANGPDFEVVGANKILPNPEV